MSQYGNSAAPSTTPLVRKLGRLGRFIAFLCSFGWLYPHVCTEDMDLTKIQNDQTAGKKRQA
jgi:hypothetical protein